MLAERGIAVSHTTILRWVVRYVPEFEKRWSRYARRVNSSWRVDETYISVRGKWHTFTSTILLSKKNLRAVQLLLGHTKLESTVRYLGIGSPQISDLVRRGHMDHVRGRIIDIGRAPKPSSARAQTTITSRPQQALSCNLQQPADVATPSDRHRCCTTRARRSFGESAGQQRRLLLHLPTPEICCFLTTQQPQACLLAPFALKPNTYPVPKDRACCSE